MDSPSSERLLFSYELHIKVSIKAGAERVTEVILQLWIPH